MHQSTTPSLSQTIWLRCASRQLLTLPIAQTLFPVKRIQDTHLGVSMKTSEFYLHVCKFVCLVSVCIYLSLCACMCVYLESNICVQLWAFTCCYFRVHQCICSFVWYVLCVLIRVTFSLFNSISTSCCILTFDWAVSQGYVKENVLPV